MNDDFALKIKEMALKIGKELDNPPVSLNRTNYASGTISFGSLVVDLITGGGCPSRKITDIFGPEGSGKSTLLYHLMANAMNDGVPVQFFDHEAGTDPIYLQSIGLDFSISNPYWTQYQPTTAEQTYRVINRILDGLPDVGTYDSQKPKVLFAIDSIAAMLPESLDENDDGNTMGVDARSHSYGMKLIRSKLARKACSLVFINQLRDRPGVSFGSPEYEPGGNAIKFYPDLKIRISGVGKSTIEGGHQVRFINLRTTKNKQFIPFQVAKEMTRIAHGHGIDKPYDTFGYLKLTGQVKNASGYYTITMDHPRFSNLVPNPKLQKAKFFELIGTHEFIALCRDQLNSNIAYDLYLSNQSIQSLSADDSDGPASMVDMDDMA